MDEDYAVALLHELKRIADATEEIADRLGHMDADSIGIAGMGELIDTLKTLAKPDPAP